MSKIKQQKKIGTGLYEYNTPSGTRYRAIVKLSFEGHSWNRERRNFTKIADAKKWQKKMRAEAQLGLNLPQRALDKQINQNSLGYYISEYLETKRNLKSFETIKTYLNLAEKFFGSKILIEEIDTLQCKRFARHLDAHVILQGRNAGNKLTESTKLKMMCYFKAVMEMGCDELDLKLPRFPVYSNKRSTEGALTPTHDDFARLVPELDNFCKVMIYIVTLTGMRKSDVMSTRWSDFIKVNGQTLLKFKSSKTQINQLSAVVPATLQSLLAKIPVKGPYIFQNTQTGTYTKGYIASLRSACKRAGIPNFTYHSWRKYATLLAVEAVGDINLVSMYMGWSNTKLVKDVYCPKDVCAIEIATNVDAHWSKLLAA